MSVDNMDDRNIVKLRGLPWNSTAKDVMDFLKECQVMDGEKGVHLAISHRDGRPNGEAFVEVSSAFRVSFEAFPINSFFSCCRRKTSRRLLSTTRTFLAIGRLHSSRLNPFFINRRHFRYIEVFNAKPEEFEMCLKRQNLVQQDTFIKLRGLPFSCKNEDIEQFFQGEFTPAATQ